MNLAAQIELMNAPQEFMRLCNAVLSAEHGPAYLPIDDDSPDRGNDGYLETENRVFAVHCFKRVQNQHLNRAIRQKMVGDLGKAIALKHEGLWDVAAWTFLSNYPVPEEIARAVTTMGREAGISVSWRGPDYLANALQRYPSIRPLFPALQVNDVAEQLQELAQVVHESHGSAPDLRPFVEIPRTAQEQARLTSTKPDGWEYLLFAGALLQGKESLELKWHDHQMRIPSGSGRRIDESDAPEFLSDYFNRLLTATSSMMRVFERDAQDLAFGRPGEPGDAVRIEHFATRILSCYEEMLDWAAELRSAVVPPVFDSVFHAAACMGDQPINEMRSFIDRTEREIARLPEYLAVPEEEQEPLTITLELVLTMDDGVVQEFNSQLKRAKRKIRWGF